MSRHFGIMSSRSALGGTSDRPAATRGSYAPRDHVNQYFPPGSILADAADTPFPRSNFLQTVFDIGTLGFLFFFLGLTGVAIAGSFFLLFFVAV
jgi:hypothetical protein